MVPNFPAARVLLLVVAASYLLSAALLAAARARGARVDAWVIVGWLATGLASVALTALLRPGRPAAWACLLLALAPWMVYSLVSDAREQMWVMVAVDVAGLAAIGLGLGMAREALTGG